MPRQGNLTHHEKNHQSLETNPEMVPIIELVTKDIVFITVAHMCGTLEKTERVQMWDVYSDPRKHLEMQTNFGHEKILDNYSVQKYLKTLTGTRASAALLCPPGQVSIQARLFTHDTTEVLARAPRTEAVSHFVFDVVVPGRWTLASKF